MNNLFFITVEAKDLHYILTKGIKLPSGYSAIEMLYLYDDEKSVYNIIIQSEDDFSEDAYPGTNSELKTYKTPNGMYVQKYMT